MNVLEVRGVSVHFGGLHVLDQVSFDVPGRTITGVIGPNGAGKTTLFNVITGFLRPVAGQVIHDGEPITGETPERICRRGVARTFQIARPFPRLTVRENVLVGALNRHLSPKAAHGLVDHVLRLAGLAAYADRPTTDLPVGLRKRLEVARVLATQPRIVLLDEIMGGLLPGEVAEMMALVAALPEQGITVVLIEHHMQALMELSRHVVAINQGRNLAQGTPAQIAAHPDVITAYFGEEHSVA